MPTLAEVAESGVGVLLIEQFAHVALSLANAAYVLEGGRVRYKGSAAELTARPELLQSAYLLRGHGAEYDVSVGPFVAGERGLPTRRRGVKQSIVDTISLGDP